MFRTADWCRGSSWSCKAPVDGRRWLVRKDCGGMGAEPFDTRQASIVGPDTEPIWLCAADRLDESVAETIRMKWRAEQAEDAHNEALNLYLTREEAEAVLECCAAVGGGPLSRATEKILAQWGVVEPGAE